MISIRDSNVQEDVIDADGDIDYEESKSANFNYNQYDDPDNVPSQFISLPAMDNAGIEALNKYQKKKKPRMKSAHLPPKPKPPKSTTQLNKVLIEATSEKTVEQSPVLYKIEGT